MIPESEWKWFDGGPRRRDLRRVVRDRFCVKDGCTCDANCCWETAPFSLDRHGRVGKRLSR